MRRTAMPDKPWDYLSCDLLEVGPGEEILVLTDYHSRWFELAILRKANTVNVTKSLDHMFLSHGLPQAIRTDNGPQFISEEFGEFMKECGITNVRGTPHYPEESKTKQIHPKSCESCQSSW